MQCGGHELVRQSSQVITNKCCIEHNLSLTTFNSKLKLYKQSTDMEHWSPTSKRRHRHRVFTDSTEKEAVEQYDEINKPLATSIS